MNDPIYELEGVIAECDHGLPFDATSLATLKRVRDQLVARKVQETAPAVTDCQLNQCEPVGSHDDGCYLMRQDFLSADYLDARRWRAWAKAIAEASAAKSTGESTFLIEFERPVGDAEAGFTVSQLNEWVDANIDSLHQGAGQAQSPKALGSAQDLQALCNQAVEWKLDGGPPGRLLREYADKVWYGHPDALKMAADNVAMSAMMAIVRFGVPQLHKTLKESAYDWLTSGARSRNGVPAVGGHRRIEKDPLRSLMEFTFWCTPGQLLAAIKSEIERPRKENDH